MAESGLGRTGVFISYSHEDQRWLGELQVHLKPLKRDQDIDVWDDTRLQSGSKWRDEIRAAIDRARAAVLLITPHFMASDFIAKSELPSILLAAEAEGVTVLPVILRPSRFDRDERLNRFQTVGSPSRPLGDMAPGKRDVVFNKLAQTIEDLLRRPGGSEAVMPTKPDSAAVHLAEEAKATVRQAEARKRASKTPYACRTSEKRKPRGVVLQEVIRTSRIYVSAPTESVLSSSQSKIKFGVLDAISKAGFQPQEFGRSGLPARMVWSLDAADEVMSNCQGALILALARFRTSTPMGPVTFATEFNHFEGGLAISRRLPIFVMVEEGILQRGILYPSSSQYIVTIPPTADEPWLNSDSFAVPFEYWCNSVKACDQVFLCYSQALQRAGYAIRQYLNSLGVSVFEPGVGTRVSGSMRDEVERALVLSTTCIFLFGPDDSLTERGNLIFELGYFARAKGLERTLIICEPFTTLPSDLAAVPIIRLKDRFEIAAVKAHLRAFVQTRL